MSLASRLTGQVASAVSSKALTPPIDAERRTLTQPAFGRLSYFVDDSADGRPLVLIHSLNAAPSSHEMRPLFQAFRGRRPVYALDLPGFGFSERGDRAYTVEMYVAAIAGFLSEVVGAAANVVALSLSCEFAARAAVAHPELFNSLVLISPTGLGGPIPEPPELANRILRFPLWSSSLFGLLTSRRSIEYFMGKQFVGEVPEPFVDAAYATAHQPGARFAPLAFLSGRLFSRDVFASVYAQLDRPTLILYDRDPNVKFSRLPELLDANTHVAAVRIAPSLGLPHWEQPAAVAAALVEFWGEHG